MAPIGSTISLRFIGFLLAAVVMFNLAMAFAFFAPLGRDRNEMINPICCLIYSP